MKAVVKYGKGKGLMEMRDVPEPTAGDEEVLVEVKAVSVCGSDLHIFHDNHPYWPPVVMGHEFSGVIAALGSKVTGWKVGDRIVSETRTGACGVCYCCQSGYPQVCEHKRAFGIGINGAYAKYVAGPAKLLHCLPEAIPFEVGAMLEPIAVCTSAILERCRFTAGDSVVITGPGPIGLISLAIAKAAGARSVGIIGREGIRLEKARELGADWVIDRATTGPLQKVLEMTGGQGADMLIETSGSAEGILQAFEMVRRLGTICAIGISGRQDIPIPYDRGIFKALRLEFCFSSSWTAWERAIGMIASGLLSADAIITHRLPLAEWQKAFRLLEDRQAVKVILLP